jgi:YggT family protein
MISYILILAEQFFMLMRAVLSMFMAGDENKISLFLYYVTEPVILPVRKLLSRFSSLDNLPIDISFSVAFLLLILLEYLLPTVNF